MDTNRFAAQLRAVHARIREAALDGLEDLGDEVLQDAKGLCPTGPSGTLRASGAVAVDRESGEVAVHFGQGASEEYAVIVHEDMDAVHDDGQAKFLELPFIQTGRGRGAQIIGRRVQGAVK